MDRQPFDSVAGEAQRDITFFFHYDEQWGVEVKPRLS